MDKKSRKKELALRSSAAEYLTFVASTGDSYVLSLEWGNTWEFLLLGGIKVSVKPPRV